MVLKNLYLISIFLLFANAINASESLSNERDYGDISGLLRFYYIFDPSYVKSGRANDYKIDGSAIGGHIGYISPTISNLGVATTLYYTQDTGLNETNDIDTMMAAGRFFTKDYSARAVLGELSLFYKDDNHHLILGRQKINSPLTNSIVTYMPNMFEALYYTNTQLDEFKFTLLHIDKMAYGTRTPVEFGLIGEATRTAGASQSALDSRGKFLSIEQQLLANTTIDTNGVTGFALRNTSLKNTTINIWDFYAYDIINMLYMDANYKDSYNELDYTLSAQYLNVSSVGKNLASAWLDNSSANLIGLKFSIDYENISAYVAYNHSGDGKILNIFGGDPAYTSSFFSRNAYRANVDAYKIGAVVRLKDSFKIIVSYANYGKSSTMGSFVSSKPVEALSIPKTSAQESALLFSYNPIKSINILTGAIYKNSSNNLDYALSGQYLNVRSVGKNLASAWLDNSSANLIGLKLSIDYKNISAYVAYNHSGDGKILNIFGGDPAYTSSFFSRNAYRANVDAYKIGAVVRLKDNFKIIASYANYGKSSTMGSFVSSKPVEALSIPKTSAQESALLFSYNPIKSINILTGAIYKNSEYYYNNRQINLLDLDLLITYRF